ncbi:hypothetical protein DFH09DRAFT_1066984 [Mycena vulgaris]|nr:hypothetical protein DFH09DRAFT_1066984 [Mycena vulgaris]
MATLVSDIDMEHNPPSQMTSTLCPKCHNHSLGGIKQCKGKGTDVQNWSCINDQCELDAITKNGTTHGLHYIWSPMLFKSSSFGECLWQKRGKRLPTLVFFFRNQPVLILTVNLAARIMSAVGVHSSAPIAARLTEDVLLTASTALDATPRHEFTRPLDPSYARPYVQAHRHLIDANARVDEKNRPRALESSSFHAVVWTKAAPAPPEHFRLVAHVRGRFVVSECPSLAAFAQNGLLAVLDSYSLPRWLNHDVRVPIPLMYNLLNAIAVLPEAKETDTPPFKNTRCFLHLLGALYRHILEAYTNSVLSVREQLTHISATMHLMMAITIAKQTTAAHPGGQFETPTVAPVSAVEAVSGWTGSPIVSGGPIQTDTITAEPRKCQGLDWRRVDQSLVCQENARSVSVWTGTGEYMNSYSIPIVLAVTNIGCKAR